ncbi:hypothetical protein SKAU_G00258770 [Synaphobranchus kaupii]|uniref:Uncharacterized protein n=1 Tax=Synaphobranchus kaupii TaxID=118154 RepID=A0A9Q1F4R2_SYNKA|nr:hypothetical protein SKAU_G00258770 [Synaphobranchus kaupii]
MRTVVLGDRDQGTAEERLEPVPPGLGWVIVGRESSGYSNGPPFRAGFPSREAFTTGQDRHACELDHRGGCYFSWLSSDRNKHLSESIKRTREAKLLSPLLCWVFRCWGRRREGNLVVNRVTLSAFAVDAPGGSPSRRGGSGGHGGSGEAVSQEAAFSSERAPHHPHPSGLSAPS